MQHARRRRAARDGELRPDGDAPHAVGVCQRPDVVQERTPRSITEEAPKYDHAVADGIVDRAVGRPCRERAWSSARRAWSPGSDGRKLGPRRRSAPAIGVRQHPDVVAGIRGARVPSEHDHAVGAPIVDGGVLPAGAGCRAQWTELRPRGCQSQPGGVRQDPDIVEAAADRRRLPAKHDHAAGTWIVHCGGAGSRRRRSAQWVELRPGRRQGQPIGVREYPDGVQHSRDIIAAPKDDHPVGDVVIDGSMKKPRVRWSARWREDGPRRRCRGRCRRRRGDRRRCGGRGRCDRWWGRRYLGLTYLGERESDQESPNPYCVTDPLGAFHDTLPRRFSIRGPQRLPER